MEDEGFMSSIPPVTKIYLGAIFGTTLGIKMNYIQPLSLYFNPTLILAGEYWRIFSSFLFFGSFGIHFLFNLMFIYRYCKSLEEEHYRGKTAEFIVFFSFTASLIVISGLVLNSPWLGMAFTQVFVYVWSRRNPFTLLNFLGFIVRAPYLPYVFMAFSFMLGGDIMDDLIGVVVGHIYYFLADIWPHQEGGFNMIYTPEILKRIFNENYRAAEVRVEPISISNEPEIVSDIEDVTEPVNSNDSEEEHPHQD
jgi:Derlin-2/3